MGYKQTPWIPSFPVSVLRHINGIQALDDIEGWRFSVNRCLRFHAGHGARTERNERNGIPSLKLTAKAPENRPSQ